MAAKALPEQSVLLQLLRYEPETGKLFWRERDEGHFSAKCASKRRRRARDFNATRAGTPALETDNGNGYFRSSLCGVNQYAHRVIWKLVTGEDPNIIDHIDGDTKNNRWSNLRSVSHQENLKNCALSRNNTSGAMGVTETEWGWKAEIAIDGNKRHLGLFTTKEQAIAARTGAEKSHGYHPNHGKRLHKEGMNESCLPRAKS
ncbi:MULTISPECIES: HNH endonuclease signature motif containing protein [unclassified Sulfitobacter]|uniref:HNH endonuclease n=1 Tax=Sulfitobacter phage pCB2047-C TaxID=754043 RepID=UPI0002C0A1AB|nr:MULTISPECIES: HNH endonuclease signature motif containing protein [unclassified Sulfitobacter]YP_007675260.1 HNH endonuclease [Sulfitobacter phage pCB2047-C]YP_007675401.1 HNH endonuclease [Sulfitobacter phage pCB2047-A]YP_009146201.1 HNH endonuclease [Sulfitobacter phage NYA-2014a]AGG91173.1 HNH endonuclease [Sulfitobacter phage pCB2047-C]AGH30735.1 HNH endonuclease [Sulfitobacter phage pCB2047-A]AIM40658.1 HNH endonuclease [Sulfitobacter phage NYA-2014a]PTA99582.1 HNH endonuclease [Sulf